MQAILLSAGRGQRLAPLTDTIPKPLVSVAGKPIIEYQLDKLKQAGVETLVINTGWLGKKLIAYLGTGKKFDLSIRYSVEPEIALETAGGIIQALPLIDDDQFIVCNADIYHEYKFSELQENVLQNNQEAHLVLVENPPHNPEGNFALNKDNTLGLEANTFSKKYTYSGIGLYRKSFFAGIEKGRRPLRDLLRLKIKQEKVSGQIFNGAWFDAGTQARIDAVEGYINRGPSHKN